MIMHEGILAFKEKKYSKAECCFLKTKSYNELCVLYLYLYKKTDNFTYLDKCLGYINYYSYKLSIYISYLCIYELRRKTNLSTENLLTNMANKYDLNEAFLREIIDEYDLKFDKM